ncbi:MAG: hypothetical protein KQ78_02105 [Candidatus Izimaplasma bacterium HR2]|nr:MAG: hypothetical protein KQ78_02105 [Candidatus Izimaplasma bacterium HR2]
MTGITFQIVIGKWSKPKIRLGKFVYGICLGWITFSIVLADVEMTIGEQGQTIKKLERMQSKSDNKLHKIKLICDSNKSYKLSGVEMSKQIYNVMSRL